MRISSVLLLAGLLLFAGAAVHAQVNAEVNTGLQLDFSTPGARSLALGGAFVGLADDATAAFTNPAGLTILSKPEISGEGRRWNFKNSFVSSGHAFGSATGMGTDTTNGLHSGTADSSASGLSFLSFVYPGRRWALAGYRHQLADFGSSFRTQGPFFTSSTGLLFRVLPVEAHIDLKISDLGVSGAYRLTDQLTVGLGLSSYTLKMNARTSRFLSTNAGPADFSPTNVLSFQDQKGDDSNIAVNAGLIYKISDKLSLGGVYRQGPKFDLRATNTFGPAAGPNFSGQVRASQVAVFHIPDVYGLGVAFRLSDAATVTADFDRVFYSNLTEQTTNVFSAPDDSSPATADNIAATKHLKIDDANEFHLGVEYLLVKMHYPIALRAGAWRDPDHRIRFKGMPVTDTDFGYATRFRPGKSEMHYSAGLGWVLGSFQIDAAADFSKPVDTLSLSGVFRF